LKKNASPAAAAKVRKSITKYNVRYSVAKRYSCIDERYRILRSPKKPARLREP
jgi:hypothetical protein